MRAGITVCAVWPVALVVRSVRLLAFVSQASVAICFAFVIIVVSIALGSKQRTGAGPRPPARVGALVRCLSKQRLLPGMPTPWLRCHSQQV